MVTFRYFLNYFVLLTLQSSVLLCAGQQAQSASTSIPDGQSKIIPASEPEPSVSSPNILKELQKTENNVSVPQPDSSLQLGVTQNNSTNINVANNVSNVEFPKTVPDGTKMFYSNKTVEVPPSISPNITAVSKDQKETPTNQHTGMKCNMTIGTLIPNTTNSSGKSDTEVPDLLNNTVIKIFNANEISDKPPSVAVKQTIDRDTELIEDGENTEDVLKMFNKQVDPPSVPLLQGQLAAILAAVFVVICVIAYVGLLSWRRYLENRYGNRQMLINEDELNDRDDLRHFTVSNVL